MTAPHVQADFETHWRYHTAPEISRTKKQEAQAFFQPVLEQLNTSGSPVALLDVGCGDGVHAAVLAEHGLGAHRYYGLDLSLQAVRLARLRSQGARGAVRLYVGDALTLPYRAQCFDMVFSYGVLAYTGAPETAFAEMVRVCKPGGLIGIWLYPQVGGVAGLLFSLTRKACRVLGPRFSKIVVSIVVLLLPLLPVRSGVNLFNASWQQCVEVVEVNLFPQVLEFYTMDDVLGWFRRHGLTVCATDAERPVTLWARVAE
jgi:ubiquinone/menaquinone biosynthesis C-methylase UbiE